MIKQTLIDLALSVGYIAALQQSIFDESLINEVDPKVLKIADHVFVYRSAFGGYIHHGIVVNIDPIRIMHPVSNGSTKTGLFKTTDLDTFLGIDGKLEIASYDCSEAEVLLSRPSTKYVESRDSIENILKRAEECVCNDITYCLIGQLGCKSWHNCETCAFYCSTGKSKYYCDQIIRATDTIKYTDNLPTQLLRALNLHLNTSRV